MLGNYRSKEWLRQTTFSLLELEINTIHKPNMTAEPPPSLPHALLDIAGQYARALAHMGIPVEDCFVGTAGEPEANESLKPWRELWKDQTKPKPDVRTRKNFNEDLLHVDYLTFDRLRWAARAGGILIHDDLSLAVTPPAVAAERKEGDDVLIERICSNCDIIKAILQKPEAAALSGMGVNASQDQIRNHQGPTRREITKDPIPPEKYPHLNLKDRIQLRKIWDIGTERIVVQTVVQLTGDIVNRVVPGISTSRDGQILLELHRLGVETAVTNWRSLLETVLSFTKGALATALGRRPG